MKKELFIVAGLALIMSCKMYCKSPVKCVDNNTIDAQNWSDFLAKMESVEDTISVEEDVITDSWFPYGETFISHNVDFMVYQELAATSSTFHAFKFNTGNKFTCIEDQITHSYWVDDSGKYEIEVEKIIDGNDVICNITAVTIYCLDNPNEDDEACYRVYY